MAVPPCLRLADQVFPRVRAAAARRLVQAGWSQSRAGEALGISQAMVSKHLSGSPDEDALVGRLADEFAWEIQSEGARPRSPGPSGTREAKAALPTSPASPWCATLTVVESLRGGSEALEDLLAAESLLRRDLGSGLVPQIGLNLVRALPGATGPEGVLGYPARLVAASGRLLAPAPPEAGGSRHLALCLLHVQARNPVLQSLASVRGGPDVAAATRRLRWRVTELPMHSSRPADAEARFRQAADSSGVPPTVLHDPGPPGIEPCLYVAGASARAVAEDLIRLGSVMT